MRIIKSQTVQMYRTLTDALKRRPNTRVTTESRKSKDD